MAVSIRDRRQAGTGFDRLLVAQQASASRARPAGAATPHRDGRSGLSLLAQGTPAHNTTGAGAGYSSFDDADASFDDRRTPAVHDHSGRLAQARRQCLAEALGGMRICLLACTAAAGATRRARGPCSGRCGNAGYWMDA
jgi:hypothetical protein